MTRQRLSSNRRNVVFSPSGQAQHILVVHQQLANVDLAFWMQRHAIVWFWVIDQQFQNLIVELTGVDATVLVRDDIPERQTET
ncbi:hypothetical protein D3C75_1149670 [compost metagenome]